MLGLCHVKGKSMEPTIPGGSFCLTHRLFRKTSLKTGDFVVVGHDMYGDLVKEVVSNDRENRSITLTGHNSESVSTEKMGAIPYAKIKSKVLYSIKKPN